MKNFSVFLLVALLLHSCKKEGSDPLLSNKSFLHGAFVCNEGNFGANNASISHISTIGMVTHDVYLQANGVELGDVLQSFAMHANRGYAVLNNSQKIEVIQLSDMKNVATIQPLSYPRYFLPVNAAKAYISNGNLDGQVVVVDMQSNTITGTIPVGYGPEKLVQSMDHVFVCNSGGWSFDHTVSVINSETDLVEATIEVGDVPINAVVDYTGDVWILCMGRTLYDASWNISGHTSAMLYRIDSSSLQVEWSSTVGSNGDHPVGLAIDPTGHYLYLNNDGIKRIEVDQPQQEQFISGSFGSLDVHPQTGEIWCASVSDYLNPSSISVYNQEGNLLRTHIGGLATNRVVFN